MPSEIDMPPWQIKIAVKLLYKLCLLLVITRDDLEALLTTLTSHYESCVQAHLQPQLLLLNSNLKALQKGEQSSHSVNYVAQELKENMGVQHIELSNKLITLKEIAAKETDKSLKLKLKMELLKLEAKIIALEIAIKECDNHNTKFDAKAIQEKFNADINARYKVYTEKHKAYLLAKIMYLADQISNKPKNSDIREKK